MDKESSVSVSRQCELLEVPRSSYYHCSEQPDKRLQDEMLMQEIDRAFLEDPTFGNRRLLNELQKKVYAVGRDRVRLLMAEMGPTQMP